MFFGIEAGTIWFMAFVQPEKQLALGRQLGKHCLDTGSSTLCVL